MRKIDEVVSDIKSVLNDIDRTQECDGEDVAKINELIDEILAISCKPQKSQGDKIRAMSDEELAEFIECPHDMHLGDCRAEENETIPCIECILEWLKSEVKE